MPEPPHIDLVAKLNRAHARPDYDIFAGDQRVGRIYLMHQSSKAESWLWSLNSVMVDSTIGVPIKGYTDSLPKAQESFRSTFNRWLEWARTLPSRDLKHKQVWIELRKMGAA